MSVLQANVPDDLITAVESRAAASQLSRDEYITRALQHYARVDPARVQASMDAFFANAEHDAELCERQVTENARRMLG